MAEKHPWVGQKVMVYQDPISRERPEGQAVILKAHPTPEFFRVRFVSDGYETDRFLLHLAP